MASKITAATVLRVATCRARVRLIEPSLALWIFGADVCRTAQAAQIAAITVMVIQITQKPSGRIAHTRMSHRALCISIDIPLVAAPVSRKSSVHQNGAPRKFDRPAA